MKNSLAPKIVNDLPNDSNFSAYDPLVKSFEGGKKIELFKDRYEALKDADCLIVLTDHEELKNIDIKKVQESMKNPLILDCMNIYSDYKEDMRDIEYIAVGSAV